MDFKVGDIVKNRVYGNKFKITAIHESEIIGAYVVVSNEPYQHRSCECHMMIDLEKFEREWYKVK